MQRQNDADLHAVYSFMEWWQKQFTIISQREDGLELWKALLTAYGEEFTRPEEGDEPSAIARIVGGTSLEDMFFADMASANDAT